MDRLFAEVPSNPGYALTIDLAGQTVAMPDGQLLHFEIDPGIKQRLLLGLDEIAMTMQSADDIRRFEVRRRAEAAWLFPEIDFQPFNVIQTASTNLKVLLPQEEF